MRLTGNFMYDNIIWYIFLTKTGEQGNIMETLNLFDISEQNSEKGSSAKR